MTYKKSVRPLDVISLDDHPLINEECYLATHSVEMVCNYALQLLRSRRPGIVLYGNPRVGKTYGIEYFIRNHPQLLGRRIPIYHLESWTRGPKTQSTESRFFGAVLKSIGYDLPYSGSAAVRLDRAVDLILEATRESGDKRALLIVDEGQNLGKPEYGYLMDLFNPLRRRGCRFKVLTVAQPEIRDVVAQMAKYPQIRERFHTDVRQIPGLRVESELARLLKIIDDEAFYPEDSNWTYTYFFIPKAYTAGVRLADHANILWTHLKSHTHERGECTVQSAMDLVSELLSELSEQDGKDLEIDSDHVKSICSSLRRSVTPNDADANSEELPD